MPALMAGLSAVDAAASTGPDNAVPDASRGPRREAEAPLRLAQSGDVEIYIDEYGRRVIVDSFTGEVLGIQRPRQNRDYRRQRRLRELNRDQGGFLLEDPDADIPYRPRPYYQGQAGRGISGDRARDRCLPRGAARKSTRTRRATYPEEPQPRVVTREPIERQPLDDGAVATGADDASPAPARGVEGAGRRLLRPGGSCRPAGAARPQGRIARRHRRAFRLQCRQGACRLSRHHRPEPAFDRHRGHQEGAGRDAAATPSRPTRSRRRMRPGRSSPRCRPTTATRPSSTG